MIVLNRFMIVSKELEIIHSKRKRGEKEMLEKKKMNRINELAKMAKEGTLSSDEKKEQEQLRKEYLAKFRESFRNRLDNLDIEYVD